MQPRSLAEEYQNASVTTIEAKLRELRRNDFINAESNREQAIHRINQAEASALQGQEDLSEEEQMTIKRRARLDGCIQLHVESNKKNAERLELENLCEQKRLEEIKSSWQVLAQSYFLLTSDNQLNKLSDDCLQNKGLSERQAIWRLLNEMRALVAAKALLPQPPSDFHTKADNAFRDLFDLSVLVMTDPNPEIKYENQQKRYNKLTTVVTYTTELLGNQNTQQKKILETVLGDFRNEFEDYLIFRKKHRLLTAIISGLTALAGLALIIAGVSADAILPTGLGCGVALIGLGLFARTMKGQHNENLAQQSAQVSVSLQELVK